MSRFIIILLLASLACGQVITDPAPMPTVQSVNVQVSEPLDPILTVTPTMTATSVTPAPLIQTLPTPWR